MLKLFVLGIVVFNLPAYAEIYQYRDANGQLYVTDTPQDESFTLISIFRPHLTSQSSAGFNLQTYRQNKIRFTPDIRYVAQKYDLDPLLLHAIIDTESAFNPNAQSKAGAVGLMQLMPSTAKSLGVRNSKNPIQNIHGGAQYFRQLLDRFNQDIELSLAAYNAGPTAVAKAGNKVPNYSETKRYIQKVLSTYHSLQ